MEQELVFATVGRAAVLSEATDSVCAGMRNKDNAEF